MDHVRRVLLCTAILLTAGCVASRPLAADEPFGDPGGRAALQDIPVDERRLEWEGRRTFTENPFKGVPGAPADATAQDRLRAEYHGLKEVLDEWGQRTAAHIFVETQSYQDPDGDTVTFTLHNYFEARTHRYLGRVIEPHGGRSFPSPDGFGPFKTARHAAQYSFLISRVFDEIAPGAKASLGAWTFTLEVAEKPAHPQGGCESYRVRLDPAPARPHRLELCFTAGRVDPIRASFLQPDQTGSLDLVRSPTLVQDHDAPIPPRPDAMRVAPWTMVGTLAQLRMPPVGDLEEPFDAEAVAHAVTLDPRFAGYARRATEPYLQMMLLIHRGEVLGTPAPPVRGATWSAISSVSADEGRFLATTQLLPVSGRARAYAPQGGVSLPPSSVLVYPLWKELSRELVPLAPLIRAYEGLVPGLHDPDAKSPTITWTVPWKNDFGLGAIWNSTWTLHGACSVWRGNVVEARDVPFVVVAASTGQLLHAGRTRGCGWVILHDTAATVAWLQHTSADEAAFSMLVPIKSTLRP